MEKFTDLVGWLIGALAAMVFFAFKASKKSDGDKFIAIFEEQKRQGERLVHVETELENISEHFMSTLDDIKRQCGETAKDITDIKVSIAKIPKRKGDD